MTAGLLDLCALLIILSPAWLQVLHTWEFEAKIYHPNDNIFNLITLGLYGCCTKRGSRVRNMRMILTDHRVLMKEELFMKVPTVKVRHMHTIISLHIWMATKNLNLS